MGYEVLEHTADVGLRVWSGDLDGLFAEAGRALVAIMGRPGPGETREAPVELDAPDLEALFVDWLSELLYVFEGRGMVPDDFDVHVSVDPPAVRGTVRGPDAATFEQEGPAVKAVTYHRLGVARTPDGYEARVYLDI